MALPQGIIAIEKGDGNRAKASSSGKGVNRMMPAKDVFHEPFVRALKKDNRTITDDPLTFRVMDTDLLIDIGAERLVGAERGS